MNLNPHQQTAVDCDDDRILVKAGAGSGKTQVLTRRIARLMDAGYHPKEILALTFTRAAAAEMRERIVKLVGPRGKLLQVSTFHSWACARCASGTRSSGCPGSSASTTSRTTTTCSPTPPRPSGTRSSARPSSATRRRWTA